MIDTKVRLKIARLLGRLLQYVVPARVQTYVEDCRRELSLYGHHLTACEQALRLINGSETVRLELGGGEPRIGWINVDLFSPESGLSLDLRGPLPLPDCSVDVIYSEHVLEHFSFPHPLMDLLRECLRILKPGGNFSAAVPDVGLAFRAYAQGWKRFYELKTWTNPDPSYYKCPMHEISWLIYMDGHHRFIFDTQNLVIMLQEAGFSEVKLRDFDPNLDRATRRHQTIYVEAIKSVHGASSPQNNQLQLQDDLLSLYHRTDGSVSDKTWRIWMRLLVLCSGHAGWLLDLGCGDGQFLELVSYQQVRTRTDLHGVETSQDLLQEANRRVPGAHLELWSGERLPYAESSFNLIVCRETLDSLEIPGIVLAEAWRVLAPQGRLIILTMYRSLIESISVGLPLFHRECLIDDSQTLFIFRKPPR